MVVQGQPPGAPGEAPAPAALPKPKPKLEIVLNPSEVKNAVTFLETCAANGKDPAEVISGIRTLVPADIIAFLREEGVDAFLKRWGPRGGILTTIAGKQFVRKVAELLLEQ